MRQITITIDEDTFQQFKRDFIDYPDYDSREIMNEFIYKLFRSISLDEKEHKISL